MSRPSDLTDLFAPPPASGSQPMSYRQGVIIEFNPITLANVVRVGGADVANLALLGIAEATTLAPGDVVGVILVGATWAIIGRLVIPGTPAAAEALSVTSANTYSVSEPASDTTSTTSFSDLATVGPIVEEVLIGSTGRCLVHISSIIVVLTAAEGGEMGYAVDGATTVAPSEFGKTLAHYGSVGCGLSATRTVLQEGLNPGMHRFTAKYFYGGGAGSVQFSSRNLTVVAL